MSDELRPSEKKTLDQKLRRLRAQIHGNPELSQQEFETTRLVRQCLSALELTPVELGLPTGAAALLRGGLPGPTVGLRADLDALPIREETGAACASRTEGLMHACGHDVHTAALLGAAELLSGRRETLRGNVLFLFQPAEELAIGAKQVMEQGIFRRVQLSALLCLHVWPGLPLGEVGLREGPFLAAVDSFRIEINGRGGHGSAPYLSCSPIPTGAALALAIPSIRSGDLSPTEPGTVAVTSVQSGQCDNVIPDRCTLLGTIRTFSETVRQTVLRRLQELTHSTAAAGGCTAEVHMVNGAPPQINDPALVQVMESSARALFGENASRRIDPLTISEDFAYYGAEVPTCCAMFGVGGNAGLHSAAFFPEDTAVLPAAEFLAESALRALERAEACTGGC